MKIESFEVQGYKNLTVQGCVGGPRSKPAPKRLRID